MKGITIYHFTERVTLIALDQSTLPLRNQDEFGIFFVEKVACIVISQLQSVSQLPQTFLKIKQQHILSTRFSIRLNI